MISPATGRAAASIPHGDGTAWSDGDMVLERVPAAEPDGVDGATAAKAAYHGGMASLAAGDVAGAVAALREATILSPEVALYHHHLGNALSRSGDDPGAFAGLGRARALDPEQASFAAELATAHLRAGHAALAAEILLACLALEPDGPRHHYFLAKAKLASGPQHDRPGALAELRRAVDLSPQTVRFRLELVQLLCTDDPAAAMAEAAAAEPLLAEPTDAIELAEAVWRCGKAEEAFRILQAAIKRWPSNQDIVLKLADWLHRHDRAEEGSFLLQDYSDQHEMRPDLWHYLGHLLFARGNFTAGEIAYGRAAFLQPANHAFSFHKALAAVPAGRPEAALRAMQGVLPDTARGLRTVGCFRGERQTPPQIEVEFVAGETARFGFDRGVMTEAPAAAKSVMVRFLETYEFLVRLCLEMTRPTARFVFDVTDFGAERPGTAAFCSNDPGVLLLPDHIFLRTDAYAGYKRLTGGARDWAERLPVAHWRGTTTGRWDGGSRLSDGILDLARLPRLRLCQLSRQRPDLLDARVTVFAQLNDADVEQAIREEGLHAAFSPAETMANYRYLIDIDGNSHSWSGLFQRLLTGSTVIKVGSAGSYRQWYYDRLKPWVHYAPVRPDMSDLHVTVERLMCDDELARSIGENGRALALSMSVESELALVADRLDRWEFG